MISSPTPQTAADAFASGASPEKGAGQPSVARAWERRLRAISGKPVALGKHSHLRLECLKLQLEAPDTDAPVAAVLDAARAFFAFVDAGDLFDPEIATHRLRCLRLAAEKRPAATASEIIALAALYAAFVEGDEEVRDVI